MGLKRILKESLISEEYLTGEGLDRKKRRNIINLSSLQVRFVFRQPLKWLSSFRFFPVLNFADFKAVFVGPGDISFLVVCFYEVFFAFPAEKENFLLLVPVRLARKSFLA